MIGSNNSLGIQKDPALNGRAGAFSLKRIGWKLMLPMTLCLLITWGKKYNIGESVRLSAVQVQPPSQGGLPKFPSNLRKRA